MTNDYSLYYTSGKYITDYVKDKSKKDLPVKRIDITGDCSIMTYDPRVIKNPTFGNIRADFNNGQDCYKNGTSAFFSPVHFSKKQADVLPKIAALGGDTTKLEEIDLEKLKAKKEEFGLTQVKYDKTHGVATLLWDDEMLRIDFVTKNETTTATATTTTNNKTYIPKDNPNVDEMYQEFYNLIPAEYDKYISEVAKEAEVSEDLIRNIILTEGKEGTRRALLKTYLCANNTPTIGFGHTDLCRGTDEFDVENDMTIDIDMAFKLLKDDLIYIKPFIIKKVGGKDKYDALPQSLKETCIDYAFHAGPNGRLNGETFKDNLENKYYHAIASTTFYNKGDLRRSAYRFMAAIKDLDNDAKKNALSKLKNQGYYNKIITTGLGGAEKLMFIDFCKSIETL